MTADQDQHTDTSVADGLSTDTAVRLIILVSLAVRLLFASVSSLGIDESYTVATARHLALSTFDHPPMAWWIAGLTARLAGSQAALIVRLPFLLLFCVSLWQMYRLGAELFSQKAGLYAAALLACSPVLGITTASWVLPDGPLIAAMLIAARCLVRVLFRPGTSPKIWLWAGFWSGMALLSKYHGIFLFAGTGLFLLVSSEHRRWLRSPWPYLGGLVALVMFLPVIIWNVQNDWASFAFQGGRASAHVVRPWMPFVAIAGQALFLLPPIWFWLVQSAFRDIRSRFSDARRLFLICVGSGSILVFTMAAISAKTTFFHWAAPGYLMLFPLAGSDFAVFMNTQTTRAIPRAIVLTGSFVIGVMLIVCALLWQPLPWPGVKVSDPFADLRSWSEVADAFRSRGYLGQPGTFVATTRWYESGRVDYALGGSAIVTCLCADPRGYGLLAAPSKLNGMDAILLLTPERAPLELANLQSHFASVDADPDLMIFDKGRVIMTYKVFRGTAYRN